MGEVKKAAVVIAVVVAIVAAVAVWLLRPGPSAGLRQATSGAVEPFDGRGRIVAAADRGLFNDRGTRVAVIGGRGIGIAEDGKVRYLTRSPSNVVDGAWLAGTTRLLVAEGPGQTGRLSILGVDGKAAGFVELAPSVGFGSGYGMTIDAARDQAVVTAVERPALADERRNLVLVDLASGATRPLTPPGGDDEAGPHFAGDATVAFTRWTKGVPSAAAASVGDGVVRPLSPVGLPAIVVGVIADRHVVYVSGRDVWAVPASGGRRSLLATLEVEAALVAVDPTGGRGIVALRDDTGAAELRTVKLDKPR